MRSRYPRPGFEPGEEDAVREREQGDRGPRADRGHLPGDPHDEQGQEGVQDRDVVRERNRADEHVRARHHEDDEGGEVERPVARGDRALVLAAEDARTEEDGREEDRPRGPGHRDPHRDRREEGRAGKDTLGRAEILREVLESRAARRAYRT